VGDVDPLACRLTQRPRTILRAVVHKHRRGYRWVVGFRGTAQPCRAEEPGELRKTCRVRMLQLGVRTYVVTAPVKRGRATNAGPCRQSVRPSSLRLISRHLRRVQSIVGPRHIFFFFLVWNPSFRTLGAACAVVGGVSSFVCRGRRRLHDWAPAVGREGIRSDFGRGFLPTGHHALFLPLWRKGRPKPFYGRALNRGKQKKRSGGGAGHRPRTRGQADHSSSSSWRPLGDSTGKLGHPRLQNC